MIPACFQELYDPPPDDELEDARREARREEAESPPWDPREPDCGDWWERVNAGLKR